MKKHNYYLSSIQDSGKMVQMPILYYNSLMVCLYLYSYISKYIVLIAFIFNKRMPKIKTLRTAKAPKGFEQIQPVLEEFQKQMKDAENAPMDAQTKQQNYWRIMRLHHQRSRYIYDAYYTKKQLPRQLYEYLLRQKFADASLIAKWKKNGYEKLCCLQCIYSKDTNYKNACICRVPKADLKEDKLVMCNKCGCRGCCSTD